MRGDAGILAGNSRANANLDRRYSREIQLRYGRICLKKL